MAKQPDGSPTEPHPEHPDHGQLRVDQINSGISVKVENALDQIDIQEKILNDQNKTIEDNETAQVCFRHL